MHLQIAIISHSQPSLSSSKWHWAFIEHFYVWSSAQTLWVSPHQEDGQISYMRVFIFSFLTLSACLWWDHSGRKLKLSHDRGASHYSQKENQKSQAPNSIPENSLNQGLFHLDFALNKLSLPPKHRCFIIVHNLTYWRSDILVQKMLSNLLVTHKRK